MRYKEFLTKDEDKTSASKDINSLFESFLIEGVHDKGIFKAVFLTGAPGSGKDYVLDNALSGHGLTEINSDKALEFLSSKNVSESSIKAKNVTELRQRLAITGRNGLIINCSGDDLERITKIKSKLDKIGYDTAMIAVVTDDEVSRQRNIERGQRGGRTVPEEVRKSKWDAASNARPELAKLFGQNYIEFDNSVDLRSATPDIVKQKKDEMSELYANVSEFVAKPADNEISKEWIAAKISGDERVSKDVLDNGSDKIAANPDLAGDSGLQFYGSGKYGKDGVVTHHSVHGKLVQAPKKEEKKKIKENINDDFSKFISESVSVTITGDTPEEVAKTIKLLTGESEEAEVVHALSTSDAKNLLQLTTSEDVPEAAIPEPTWGSTNIKENHESTNHLVEKSVQGRGLISESTGSNCKCNTTEGSCDAKGGSETKTKKTLLQAKEQLKQKINEIDSGTEVGISMSGGGENATRGSLSNRPKKRPFDENIGDGGEAASSISDKKEDELKKTGIVLSTFRGRNYQ